jgi:hypothetical protein
MRRIANLTWCALLLLAGCSRDATGPDTSRNVLPPSDPAAPIIVGGWDGSTSYYSLIRLSMIERASDHVLNGEWTGVRRGCTSASGCADWGIVVNGDSFRAGPAIQVRLTALNGTRSLKVVGTMARDSTISGKATLTDDGDDADPESVTFRLHH